MAERRNTWTKKELKKFDKKELPRIISERLRDPNLPTPIFLKLVKMYIPYLKFRRPRKDKEPVADPNDIDALVRNIEQERREKRQTPGQGLDSQAVIPPLPQADTPETIGGPKAQPPSLLIYTPEINE